VVEADPKTAFQMVAGYAFGRFRAMISHLDMGEFAELPLRISRQMASIIPALPVPRTVSQKATSTPRSGSPVHHFQDGLWPVGKLSCRETPQIEEVFGSIVAHLQL
jgi:hypothetical protein